MTGLLVGVLVGLAVAALGADGARLAAVAAPDGSGRAARSRGVPRDGEPAAGVRRRRERSTDDPGVRLAATLVETAALLRAGSSPGDAWQAVLGAPVRNRVPSVAELEAAVSRASPRWAARPRRRGAAGPPVAAVVAAARVADELGAPLAAVLDQVAAAIAAQAEAAADVAAALAAPRSSARVLAWLPAAGLLLGMALGADPVGVLLGGGLGTASGVAGVALLLVGRRWTSALLRRAERAGETA